MSKKQIYIHIGTPKTGSTSIQTFITRNIDILAEEGLFYPIIGRGINENLKPEEVKTLKYGPVVNGEILNSKSKLKNVLKDFAKSGMAKMLLSEETLFWQDDYTNFFDNLRLLSDYEIKIIIYFRRSIDYLCSLWQQCLKHPINHVSRFNYIKIDLLDFLENYPYIVEIENFYNLSKKVDKKNVIVRTFEKESWLNNDLIEDFLSTLGLKKSKKFQDLKNDENIGLTRERADKLLYIKKHLFTDELNHWNIENILPLIPIGNNNQKIIDSIPDELIEKITDKYYEEECKIAKIFLDREELFQSKYPKIYKKNRPEYKTQISNEDKEELRFIVNSALQKRIIEKQGEMIELQRQLLNKVVFLPPISQPKAKKLKVKKLLVAIICSFVPSKKFRTKIRKHFLTKS